MQNLEITNVNFVVPSLLDDGSEVKVWVAQPIESEIKGLAQILGPLFTLVREKNVDLVVFLRDWEIFVDDILSKLENGEGKKKALEAFFDRSLMTAKVYSSSGDELPALEGLSLDYFKGALLFISALYRYTFKNLLMTDMRDFFTSLSAMEFRNSLLKQSAPSTVENGVVTKRN